MADKASCPVLVDGREFVTGRRTGIGRFLEGLLLTATELHPEWKLQVLMTSGCTLPSTLTGRVEVVDVGAAGDIAFGWRCSKLSRGALLFLSPYPKLPLARLHCPAIHTVHDILYLTHEAYRGSRLQYWLDKIRLQLALKRSELTWFDSLATEHECRQIFTIHGETKVRYPAIEASFTGATEAVSDCCDYFLYVGNGLPHKNVGIIMQALVGIDATLKCVGIKDQFAAALLAETPAVRDRVEFLQNVDDASLLELYRSAVALLLPSTAEGYGYPPLEAMACGTPAIVADIPVLKETTGGYAVYCSPDDEAVWHQAMLHIQKVDHVVGLGEAVETWIAERQGVAGWLHYVKDMEMVINQRGV